VHLKGVGAAELGHHEHTVGKWRRRFFKDRCDGLLDEARPRRPRTIAQVRPVPGAARLEVTALLATPSAHRRMLRHRFFGKVLMSARIRLDRHNQNPGPRGQKEERGCRGTGLAARFGLLRFK
jgi:hypothetical protein